MSKCKIVSNGIGVTCDTQELVKAMRIIADVAPTKTLKPILSMVKLTVEKNAVVLEATNFDIAVRCHMEAKKTAGLGTVVLPAKRFLDTLVTISAEDVKIAQESGDVVSIRDKRGTSRLLPGISEDFPPFPEFKGTIVKIAGSIVADMIRKTAFAAAKEKSKYSLNGVYLKFAEKKMTMVATDGRRLAVRTESFSKSVDKPVFGIVPCRGIGLIRKCVDCDGDVEVGLSSGMCMVHSVKVLILVRLIEGTFPDYNKVIPDKSDTKMIADREELVRLIQRVGLYVAEEGGMNLALTSGSLSITARTPEIGDAVASMPISFDGNDMKIVLSPEYITDVLSVLDAEQVTVGIRNPGSAIAFRTDNDAYIYVVMPRE